MATLPGSTGTGGELTARSPLLLDDPGRGWRVVSGVVDVFVVELVDGEAGGRRHPLGTVGPDGALFGLRTQAGGLALLAIGRSGARVEPLDEVKLEASERAGIAERWVEMLAATTPTADDRANVLLRAGQSVAVEEGATVTSLRGTAWIADGADLALDGTALAGALPIAPGLVVTARADATLEPVEGAAAVAAGARWLEGLEALGTAVLTALGHEIASGGDRERDRLARRKSTERQETERVYTSLGRVVDRQGEPVAAPGEDPVVAACRAAGAPLGIDVAEPRRLPDAAIATRIREVARSSGFRIREVQLEDGWWRRDVGCLVGITADGEQPVALVWRRGRYELLDPEHGARSQVDSASAATLAPTAYMLYACLGREPSGGRRLLRIGLLPARADLLRLLAFSVVLGLLSLLTPIAAQAIFTRAVPEDNTGQLLGISLVLVGAALGTATVYLVQGLALLRIEARASTGTQAAVIDRLIDLPAAFFRRFTAGDLGSRALAVETIRQTITTSVTAALVALMVALFNLVYVLVLDVTLGLITIALLVAAVVVLALLLRRQIPPQRRLQAGIGETQALALQILGALPKLRVARAEERAFARWGAALGRMKEAFVATQRVFAGLGAFTAAWQALAIALVLLVVGEVPSANLSAGEFVAFTTAFATTASAILGLVGVLAAASQSVVLWERARPIVESPPEVQSRGVDPGELRGAIELAHVSFRYGEKGRRCSKTSR